ncbi:hypothetical protein Dimus_036632 [Dionaea muscipula]
MRRSVHITIYEVVVLVDYHIKYLICCSCLQRGGLTKERIDKLLKVGANVILTTKGIDDMTLKASLKNSLFMKIIAIKKQILIIVVVNCLFSILCRLVLLLSGMLEKRICAMLPRPQVLHWYLIVIFLFDVSLLYCLVNGYVYFLSALFVEIRALQDVSVSYRKLVIEVSLY